MKYDGGYLEDATLKDGRVVRLRLLRPSDRPKLVSGFNRLSDEGRYRRFLSPKTKLSQSELDYLTDVDQQTHFALGAVALEPEETEGEGAGIARFIVATESDEVADAAITVADDFQRIGLGTLLFDRLSAAAGERGISRLRGEVLATNQAMLAITRSDSQEAAKIVDGIAHVELEIEGARAPTPPETEPHSLLSLFATGRAAIRTFLAWRDEK